MQERETQDELIKMKVRNFIALLFSVIIGTNSFSIIYQKILRTEEQQIYYKERADRITDRKLEEAKQYHDIQALKRELKECKELWQTEK